MAHSQLLAQGLGFQRLGDLAGAERVYRHILSNHPNHAEALYLLGIVVYQQGFPDDALEYLGKAVQIDGRQARFHNSLGIVCRAQGNLDEARAAYERALELRPDYADVLNNLGNVCRDQGHLEEAQAFFVRALEARPDYAEAQSNLGNVYRDQGRLRQARNCYQDAIRRKPDFADAHCHLGMLLLLCGDYQRGWEEYDWRLRCAHLTRRSFREPVWDGRLLGGQTLLVYAEQGVGDTLQFLRFLALAKERGARIVFECQPLLVPLLRGIAGVDELVPGGAVLPQFAFQAPLLSLPRILNIELSTLPAPAAYLAAKSELGAPWQSLLAGLTGIRVGICWQGDPAHRDDRQRSVRLEALEPLARLPGVCLVSLQKGAGAEQLTPWQERWQILDLGSRFASWADTAAALVQLDLVVSVDTAVAHLAGALGVPVWVALPFAPDWRWLLDRADSPWYPGMRLFRQPVPGDWQNVFDRIASALDARKEYGGLGAN
jgi:tetratricopeptide (TPR) repeat protein